MSKDHKQETVQMRLYCEKVAEAAKNKVHIAKSKSGIVVKGIDDVAVRFSRCCNPVPGDEIVGFVTRGRGLSIHRTDCVNMIHLTEAERARLIPAEWEGNVAEETGGQYLAEIKMYARDQQGLLMEYFQSIYGDGDGCQILKYPHEQAGNCDYRGWIYCAWPRGTCKSNW